MAKLGGLWGRREIIFPITFEPKWDLRVKATFQRGGAGGGGGGGGGEGGRKRTWWVAAALEEPAVKEMVKE